VNCLELRRAVLADPRRVDTQAMQHAEQCAGCMEFLGQALQSEAKLASALRVAVPEGLRARLLDRTAASRRPVRWLALAASLLVAAAIAFFIGSPKPDPLALAGINFVVFEEAQAIADAKPADPAVFARVAREMGLSLPEQLGEVNYICFYPFAAGAAHHALVKTPLGKVTLLLIPERPLAARAIAAAYGLEAAIVPAAVGAIVIIGESGRSIGRVETLLKSI